MRRLPLVLVLLLLTPLAFAQVYKWTDTGGTVHYSETPPATGTNYKKIQTTGSADPIAMPAPAAHNAGNPSEASAKPSTPNPVADTPENRTTLCASLKANLATLQGSAPVVMQQGGKNVALDDSQRKVQTATAQAQYEQYCQNP
ncbi:MAG: DUF4124 domain-containing protein [Rhodanobacter sp.]